MDQRIKVLKTDFWESQWNLARKLSTVKITRDNRDKWSKFWDFMSTVYDEIEKNNEELILKIINTMKEERLFSKNSVVLEIGAGTGAFTIPLSQEVKQIVALDSSKGMLDRLEQRLKELDISSIKLVYEKWEKVNFNEKFDFVFAAFCPAINSKERLIKMKENSNRYVCLINISKHDEQLRMRNELWKILTGREFLSESYHIIYPFGILYSLGYLPQLRNIVTIQLVEREVEKLQEQFERYFSIFFPLTRAHKAVIRDFFNKKSIGGKLSFNNKSEIYLLWW